MGVLLLSRIEKLSLIALGMPYRLEGPTIGSILGTGTAMPVISETWHFSGDVECSQWYYPVLMLT